MYCPECGGEFRPGISECPDCRVPLVERPPQVEPTQPVELVTVFAAGNPATVAVAESLLNQVDFVFEKLRDGLQDLFGWGRFGTGFSIVVGPVLFKVPKDQAATARELLQDLETEPTGGWEALEDE